MRATLAAVLVLLPIASAVADEVQRDIPYSEAGKAATTLDVYPAGNGADHPVLVWIHGGGWRIGDKAHVQLKPQVFNDKGFVFVSLNYRLHPDADYKQQAGDVARAIRWVRDHASDFGGSRKGVFLMGHSAGAHLAALVATDPRYLKAEGMQLSDLSGVILLDGAGYDIPQQLAMARLPRMKELYLTVFGSDLETQRDASPITHVAAGQGTPPFLILHVANRPDSRRQSQALADKLNAAGASAKVVAAEGKTHATINRQLGEADDAPTEAVFEFLKQQLSKGRQ
jgi:acetyl esterase/lipase